MRLGTYPAHLAEGSVLARTYGTSTVDERHRHRYEVNNAYRDQLEEAGLRVRRHLAGRHAGGVRRAAAPTSTRTTCRPRPTRSSSRARTGPTRSSPGWSVPPSTPSARPGWSRSSVQVAETVAAVTLGAPTARTAELVDRLERRPVEPSERVFDGMVWDVVARHRGPRRGRRRCTASTSQHPGAVGVVALDDRRPGPAHPAVPPPGRRLRVGAARRPARRGRRAAVGGRRARAARGGRPRGRRAGTS